MNSHRIGLAVGVTAVICAAGCSAGQNQGSGQSPSAAPGQNGAQALEQAFTQVVSRVLPSVVEVTTKEGLGSGVVMDAQGDIVTNAHVVGTAKTFQVRLADRPTAIPATLVGTYAPDDLAVIRLTTPPSSLRPAEFGRSAALQVGDIVLAMGNPLGLTGSVTNGIVSAKGRAVTEPTEGTSPGATLPDTIQTSAAINPGNSGGALVDLTGKVIGIPTLAAIDPETGGGSGSSSGGSAAPGLGFAIPSDIVTDIAGQIVKSGKVTDSHRAALGVTVASVVGQDGTPGGAGIAAVTAGGPAAAAGLQVGEVITAVGSTPVSSNADLSAALAQLDPGASVPVHLVGGAPGDRTVSVTLGSLPGS